MFIGALVSYLPDRTGRSVESRGSHRPGRYAARPQNPLAHRETSRYDAESERRSCHSCLAGFSNAPARQPVRDGHVRLSLPPYKPCFRPDLTSGYSLSATTQAIAEEHRVPDALGAPVLLPCLWEFCENHEFPVSLRPTG